MNSVNLHGLKRGSAQGQLLCALGAPGASLDVFGFLRSASRAIGAGRMTDTSTYAASVLTYHTFIGVEDTVAIHSPRP